jgi:hypothetical protein
MKALARAFRWRRMPEEGRYGSIRLLAAAEGVDRAYVGRGLNLTLQAPDMVEAILDGRQPEAIKLPGLMEPFPVEWNIQRAAAAPRITPATAPPHRRNQPAEPSPSPNTSRVHASAEAL